MNGLLDLIRFTPWHQWLGMLGMILIVSTYLLLQTGSISSEQLRYSLLNVVGAGLLIISLLFNYNLPALIVEVFWVGVSLIGIARYVRRRVASRSIKCNTQSIHRAQSDLTARKD